MNLGVLVSLRLMILGSSLPQLKLHIARTCSELRKLPRTHKNKHTHDIQTLRVDGVPVDIVAFKNSNLFGKVIVPTSNVLFQLQSLAS